MPQATNATIKTGYAQLPSGINMYYEIHGVPASPGQLPLVLLHGGLGSTDSIAGLRSRLALTRQVVTPDLQAHGRTADIDRPFSPQAFADDVAGLIQHLKLEKVDIMGYSMGAGAALQATIHHAALVRKTVLLSTVFRSDGWYPEVVEAFKQMGPATAEMMKASPIYQTYARVAPHPEDWTKIIVKISEAMKHDYDYSAGVAAIKSPVMLVYGDADAARPEHIVQFFQLLGGGKRDGGWDNSGVPNSRLAILPGTTHYGADESPELPLITNAFLDAPMPAAK
jgi:pimeloyl-ACP methyl ester carboxylesterase